MLKLKMLFVILLKKSKEQNKKMISELTFQKIFKKFITLVSASIVLLFAFGVLKAENKDLIMAIITMALAIENIME